VTKRIRYDIGNAIRNGNANGPVPHKLLIAVRGTTISLKRFRFFIGGDCAGGQVDLAEAMFVVMAGVSKI
jgi:hypothetical protein